MASTSRSSSRAEPSPLPVVPRTRRNLAVAGAGLLAAWLTAGYVLGARSLLPSGSEAAGTIFALAVLTALWIFLLVFFRDPERTPGPDIVSAADGRIELVAREDERWRVAVFMNVTDVHVNRFPMDARVVSIEDGGWGHRPAFVRDAAHNVQRRYRLACRFGEAEVVQLTGVLARRLISLVRAGDQRPKGARLGMILLGSRVDVLLPAGRVSPCVRPGDRVRAGVTPIAREVA